MDAVETTRAKDRTKSFRWSRDGNGAGRFQSQAIATTGASAARRNDLGIQLALDPSKIHRSAAW
jgi:hypothetical protein